MNGEALFFTFMEGDSLRVADDGQQCCEQRYMTCDDDLASFVGCKLVDAEVRATTGTGLGGAGYEEHDVECLVITTTRGVITAFTHNVHNGYYGGFAVTFSMVADVDGAAPVVVAR